jgi:hypothetical protein
MFLDGLRVCIMPLAEEVGRKLPQRLPLPLVMVVAFCLVREGASGVCGQRVCPGGSLD